MYDSHFGFWKAPSLTDDKPLHKASVIQVRFDPQSSRVIASASADGFVYVTSCFEPQLDMKSTAGPFGGVASEGTEVLFKFNANAWVNTLSFNPSGSALAFSGKLNQR